jgi:sortase A
MNPSIPEQDKVIAATVAPTPTATPTPAPTNSPTPVLYTKRPKVGDKIGTITLPRLHESWAIYEGTNSSQLNRGVGHFRASVLPGMVDNVVLSGHRTTVFNNLGKLRIGSLIYVKTTAGVFTYRVSRFRIVYKTNKHVIVPTKTAVLTLTTCYPFDHVGTTTKAFIVTADLVGSKLKASS